MLRWPQRLDHMGGWMAQFDTKKFTTLDWTVVGSAAVAFISLFLPWYSGSVLGYSFSVSGWSTQYGWLGAILVIAAGVYLVLDRSGVKVVSINGSPALTEIAASGLGALIIIIRIVTLPGGSAGAGLYSFSYGPSVGIILALLAGIVAAGAAFATMRQAQPSAGSDPAP
jgi:hypothetical protein